jgi:hypothetical protein
MIPVSDTVPPVAKSGVAYAENTDALFHCSDVFHYSDVVSCHGAMRSSAGMELLTRMMAAPPSD